MTDKQIISEYLINVSACEEFSGIGDCKKTNSLCINNKDCHYKNWKRKEQECEELKEDVERWKSNFNGKVSAIEELIKIIQQALEDFSIEVGTPQYDRLLNSAKSLGIEVKDYE